MSKLLKLVCIGVVSISMGILSPSIYAGKGGVSGGGKGKSGAVKTMSHSGKGKGYGQKKVISKQKSSKAVGKRSKKSRSMSSASKPKFSRKDREAITHFSSTHPFDTTELPPGIAKNLARGKPLPPGIAKVFLPNDLVNLLGARPGYEYLVAGKDVLLVNESNQIIADILYNILR